MIAPCGIEIRVGQVWRNRYGDAPKDYNDFMVDSAPSPDGFVKIQSDFGNDYVRCIDFTNKPGGYRLVKEAPDDMQKWLQRSF